MLNSPVSAHDKNKPSRRRSTWPWVLLGGMVLAAGVFWPGDGLDRYQAAQAMRAGRIALLASDLSQAISHFRTAALHRPNDEEVMRQYHQTQGDWYQLVRGRLYLLDPVEAYQELGKLSVTGPWLIEPHASKYRDLEATVLAAAREFGVVRIAEARRVWAKGEYATAQDLLLSVEPVRALVPELPELKQELPEQSQELQGGEITEARRRAGVALEEKRFAAAREELKAGHPEFQELGRRIDEAEAAVMLADAAEAGKQGKFTLAGEKLARAEALGTDTTEMRKNLRDEARFALAVQLVQGIVAKDQAKTAAAIEQGRIHAGWEAVPVESLLAPRDVPSFMAALDKFGMGPESQGKFLDRIDIPLLLLLKARLPATEVTEYLRAGFVAWSRVMSQSKRPGFALLLDETARSYGAVSDADWRKEAVARAIASTKVTLALAQSAADPKAPAGLNGPATAAFRRALQAKLGAWPTLVDHDPARPATVVFTGRYAGFYAEDNPVYTEKFVRYQSGTRQVPNHQINELIGEHNNVMDQRNQLVRSIDQNQDRVNWANSGGPLNTSQKIDAAAAAGVLVLQRNSLQKLEQQIRELKARAKAQPKYVTVVDYAEESYAVIKHNYTCSILWELSANLHGTERFVTEWDAATGFQADSVEGDASRGVPVKAPQPVPEQKFRISLVPALVAQVADVGEVIEELPLLTLEAFEAFHKKSPPLVRLDQLLALGYAWEAAGRPMKSFPTTVKEARLLLDLP